MLRLATLRWSVRSLSSRREGVGVHSCKGGVEYCVFSFLDRPIRVVDRERRVAFCDISVFLGDLQVVFGALLIDVLTNRGDVVVPVLLHPGPPIGDLSLVCVGRLAPRRLWRTRECAGQPGGGGESACTPDFVRNPYAGKARGRKGRGPKGGVS